MKYTSEQMKKWQRISGLVQYTCMGIIFAMFILGENLPKGTARTVVYIWVMVMIVVVVVGLFISLKAHEIQMKFLREDLERIKRITYDGLEQK